MACVRAVAIARTTASGFVGMSRCRTPRCASASTTAFCTAGIAPIVPASPMPFAPNGLRGVGVSVLAVSKLGSSAALGNAYVVRFDVRSVPISS